MATKKKVKNPHAVALARRMVEKYPHAHFQAIGRKGGPIGGASTMRRHGAKHFSGAGKKGGRARARKLSAARRSEIARIAARARWRKKRNGA